MVVEALGSLFSERLRSRIYRFLRMADIYVDPDWYLGLSLLLFFSSLLLFLPLSPILAVLVSLLLFSLSLYLPQLLATIRSRRAEQELPFFLKSLSTFLKAGFDALPALKLASLGNPVLERSIKRVLDMHSRGLSLGRALKSEAETYLSDRVRRTLEFLAHIVEGGYGVESLDRYAESLLHAKRLEIRDFSNRLAMYTLLFVAITALTPSILLMYNLLLPVIFGGAPNMGLLLFLLFVAIPVLTALTLLYISTRAIV